MAIKQELTKIYQQWQTHRKNLLSLKNRYVAIIYKKTIDGESAHKSLVRETLKWQKKGVEVPRPILLSAMKQATKVSKMTARKKTSGTALAPLVFSIIEKFKPDIEIEHVVFDELRKESSLKKAQVVDEGIKKAKYNGRVFFLASRHNDSAEDHKDYQGKYYVTKAWSLLIKDKKLRKQVNVFIKKNNIKTIEWVTGKPVWFVTRPYCRHYFESVSVNEVLNNSPETLLRKYDMTRWIGERGELQTPKFKKGEDILEKYKERLAMHEEMYRKHPCEELRRAIEKDKLLIKKWTNNLKSL